MSQFALVVLIVALALGVIAIWLRNRSRAVVDGCLITVRQDTHCTAIVRYRDGKRTVRFGAEVGASGYLWVDTPDTMYTDDGHVIPADEYNIIKQRLARGLTQLSIAHEFDNPEFRRDVGDKSRYH